MPRLNFRRLRSELSKVEHAIRKKKAPGLLRCEPVEDNLMEWEVDLVFSSDSHLQQDLEALAISLFDKSRRFATIRVRFPLEYPVRPPDIWLQWPRLLYHSAPVTFGGKMCSELLSTSGWSPSSSMLTVFEQLQSALVEADARVDTSMSVKRGYPAAPFRINRLKTTIFPSANDFLKQDMTVMSAAAARPFLGDLGKLEETDKIGLSSTCADELYGRASFDGELDLPLMFEVRTQLGRKTHCSIFQFIQGLPSTHVLLPQWVMKDLFIEERDTVTIRGVRLNLIEFVKVEPRSMDFYQAVQSSGSDVNAILTQALSRFSALTEDTSVPVEIRGQKHWVRIVELRPPGAVRIIDTDVRHDFEFRVDFDPAPDLEDEAELRSRQDTLVARYREQRQQLDAGKRQAEEKCARARCQRFERHRDAVFAEAGKDAGSQGSVELALRLPTGTQLRGRFQEGAPVAALEAFILNSEWAKEHRPAGMHFLASFPSQRLDREHRITKSMHRTNINVLEVPPSRGTEDFLSPAESLKSDAGDDDGAPADLQVDSELTPRPSCSRHDMSPVKDQVVTLFRLLDTKGNGAIERQVFMQPLLKLLRTTEWGERLDRLLTASETSSNGEVNYERFFSWVFCDKCESEGGDVSECSGHLLPELDEQAVERSTQRAFEIQRFVQAGVDRTDAEKRVDAGDVLPRETDEANNSAFIFEMNSDRSSDDEQMTIRHSPRIDPEVRDQQIQDVVNFTGAESAEAEVALEESDWDTQAAINAILDGGIGGG